MNKALRKGIIFIIKAYAPFYRMFHRRTKLFQHILIQTNNKCTRVCPWCVYGITQKIDSTIISERLFDKIIDELAQMNYSGRISLFETNEPLTDDRIYDFLKQVSLKLPYAWSFLNTNGDLLNEEKTKKLFASGLDALDISSYDDISFRKIENIIKNLPLYRKRIRHFNKCKKEFLTDNRGGSLRNIFGNHREKLFCDRVNKILFIKPSGEVVSCFGDFFNKNIMGDANNSSLKEIWWGRRFEELRGHLNRCERSFSPLCKECNYVGLGGYYKVPFIKHLQKKLFGKK